MGKQNWVYVLKCYNTKDDHLIYVGTTSSLFKRFIQHTSGRGCSNTEDWKNYEVLALFKTDNFSENEKPDLDLNMENNITQHIQFYHKDSEVRGGKWTKDTPPPLDNFKPSRPFCDCGLLCEIKSKNYVCGKIHFHWDKLRDFCEEKFDYSNYDICDFTNNVNSSIYSRNVPEGNIPVNIDTRPLPTDECLDPRFAKERESLDKFNEYAPQKFDCNQRLFLPNKGTVRDYFNNIDMDSELKNINKIDTKGNINLFKIHPKDSNSSLKCNENLLVKDYDGCDLQYGYTWDNFNQYTTLEQFPVCKTQDIPCAISSPMKVKKTVYDDRYSTGQIITNEELIMLNRDLEMMEKKKQAEIKLQMMKQPKMKNVSPDIITYKSNGASNIYAPNVRVQNQNIEEANAHGYHDAVSKVVDARAEINLRKLTQEKVDCGNFSKVINLEPINQVNLARYNCLSENQKLYVFNNLMNDPSKDCYFCEKLFNNQTKRKHIVPKHPF